MSVLTTSSTENRIIFWLCFILIAGMGMSTFFDYNMATAVDQVSYMKMAHFDFDTSLHRRYRFVIPMLAAGINLLIQKPAQLINPNWLTGDFTMRFSFYLVNLTIASFWCALIYRYCRAYNMGRAGALAGLLAVATSRWTLMNVGSPHTDILFCLAVICMLYGIKTRSNRYLMLAIIIGPFSKESFLFAAPVLFFSHMPKWKTVLYLLLVGLVVFATRYFIDQTTSRPMIDSIAQDTNLLRFIPDQFTRLKTFSYWLELYATFGLWWLLPLMQKIKLKKMPATGAYLRQPYVIVFLLTSAFQIILNGEFSRMMYMLMPVYAIIAGYATEHLKEHYFPKQA